MVPKQVRENLDRIPYYFGWEKFQKYSQADWLPAGIRTLRVMIHPTYLRKYPELCREILSYFQNRKLEHQNVLAKNEYGQLWVRNFFRHLRQSGENKKSYRLLSGVLPANPKKIGCFVGASPDLESEIDWIRENQNHVFLLASDTSLGFLLANGIHPDAVLSIDSGLGTSYHFPDGTPENIPIISWFGGSTRIFDLKNPKIIYLSTHPLDQILGSRFYPNAPILENPTLNVAGLALSVCKAFGAGAMILKGVGFSREAGKTHCRTSGYERYDRFFLERKVSLYTVRYTPESRWKTRTVVLDALTKWSPIPLLTDLMPGSENFSNWENVLESFDSSFPGTGEDWRNLLLGIPELPPEIKQLIPRQTKLLETGP